MHDIAVAEQADVNVLGGDVAIDYSRNDDLLGLTDRPRTGRGRKTYCRDGDPVGDLGYNRPCRAQRWRGHVVTPKPVDHPRGNGIQTRIGSLKHKERFRVVHGVPHLGDETEEGDVTGWGSK